MKPDMPLPLIFRDKNCCLIDGFFFHETRTPPRTFQQSNVATKLSGMKSRALSLRLDGETHQFAETGDGVTYVDGQPSIAGWRTPPRVTVEMVGSQPRGSDPRPRRALSTQITALDPPRVVSVHVVKSQRSLTLLLVDESLGEPIAVIGDAVHWDLNGIPVKFEMVNHG